MHYSKNCARASVATPDKTRKCHSGITEKTRDINDAPSGRPLPVSRFETELVVNNWCNRRPASQVLAYCFVGVSEARR